MGWMIALGHFRLNFFVISLTVVSAGVVHTTLFSSFYVTANAIVNPIVYHLRMSLGEQQ
jgi:hypothetical protein